MIDAQINIKVTIEERTNLNNTVLEKYACSYPVVLLQQVSSSLFHLFKEIILQNFGLNILAIVSQTNSSLPT